MATIARTVISLFLSLAVTHAFAAKPVVIDVRTPAEYSAGHVPGASNIEYQNIAGGISKLGAGKEDKIVLYCRSGSRANTALKALRELGYQNVHNYGSLEEATHRLAVEK